MPKIQKSKGFKYCFYHYSCHHFSPLIRTKTFIIVSMCIKMEDLSGKLVFYIYFVMAYVNPLPDDKILDWFKLIQIVDDILKCISNEK